MRHLFLFLVFFASIASAEGDRISEYIASLQSGVICPPPTIGSTIAPDTVAGVTNIVEDDPPFVSEGNRVPAVLGVGFGIKALADRLGGLSDVTMIVTHPPMGDEAREQQSFQTSISGTDPSLTFYQFDYTYELLPGRWTMTAIKDNRTLYVSEFLVVPPEQMPELASACGFEELLS